MDSTNTINNITWHELFKFLWWSPEVHGVLCNVCSVQTLYSNFLSKHFWTKPLTGFWGAVFIFVWEGFGCLKPRFHSQAVILFLGLSFEKLLNFLPKAFSTSAFQRSGYIMFGRALYKIFKVLTLAYWLLCVKPPWLSWKVKVTLQPLLYYPANFCCQLKWFFLPLHAKLYLVLYFV